MKKIRYYFKKALELIVCRIKSGTFSVLLANVLNKAVGMMSTMIVTRIVSTNDYGVWTYTLNMYSYLLLISGFGLAAGAMQFGAENIGNGRANSFFKYCLKTGVIIDLFIISFFGVIMINAVIPIPRAKCYIIAILPMLIVEYILSIAQAMLRSQNRIHEFAICLNVNAVLITLGNCIGAYIGLNGLLIGRYVANILSLVLILYYFQRQYRETINADVLERSEKKDLWKYSLYTGASSAMNILVYSLDITLIAYLIKNEREVAIYRIGTLIPTALSFIPNSILVAILPTIIYHRADFDWIKNAIRKLIFALFGCNALVCLLFFIYAPFVLTVFAGSKYIPSVPILRILILGYLVSGTFGTISINILASLRRVKYGLLISVLSCVLDISLNYFLIMKMGSVGAAFATLLVHIIVAVMSMSYLLYLIRKRTLTELCT